MDPASPREIHYRVMATVRGQFPGRHRSTRGASGFEFRGHASLMDVPDPRHERMQPRIAGDIRGKQHDSDELDDCCRRIHD